MQENGEEEDTVSYLQNKMQKFSSRIFRLTKRSYDLSISSYPDTLFRLNRKHSLSAARFCGENIKIGNHPSCPTRAGFGFVCLNKEDSVSENRSEDEFAADVEKIYKVLRKFHSRVPKLELALQESGVVLRSGLPERVLNRCGDAGNLGYRFFVWASKQPGYKHSYEYIKV